jgi:hypothetical protein
MIGLTILLAAGLSTLVAVLATFTAILLTAALLAATFTSGLLILLAGFLLLPALLTRVLVLTAHEATPLRGTIPLQEKKGRALWFLAAIERIRRARSVTDQNHRNCRDISNDK